MKLIIVKDYEAMSEAAAKEVIMALQTNAELTLGLATGGTPEGLYQQLVAESVNGRLDWSKVRTFNLDEYVGLDAYHPLSYHTYMHEKFFAKVNLKKRHIHLPKGTGNSERNIAKYQKAIDKVGGIDLQILGIGENAHIAFNEPGASKDDGIRIVELTPATIKANARYFTDESQVPRTAITMGVGTILKAKRIILLANGEKKAQAIKNTIEGPITSNVPASFLQLHNNVTLIIDQAAASALKKSDLLTQDATDTTALAPTKKAPARPNLVAAPMKKQTQKVVTKAAPKPAVKQVAPKAITKPKGVVKTSNVVAPKVMPTKATKLAPTKMDNKKAAPKKSAPKLEVKKPVMTKTVTKTSVKKATPTKSMSKVKPVSKVKVTAKKSR